MTSILKALMSDESPHLRISCGNRWLYWDGGLWVVREALPYAKKSKVIIETNIQDAAVVALLGSDSPDE